MHVRSEYLVGRARTSPTEALQPACHTHPGQGETLGRLRHGQGTHTSSNGDLYEGQWRYDKRHGRGKVVLHSGVQYEGEWRDDLAHG